MKLVKVLIVLSTLLFGTNSYAEEAELTAIQVVQKAHGTMYAQGQNSRVAIRMTTISNNGRPKTSEFVSLRLNEGVGEQKFYVYFRSPATIAKMAFLTWKHANGSNDRWLYYAAADVIKRIAPTDERTQFASSYFFHEDITGRHPGKDNHELGDTTSEDYFVVNSTPTSPGEVEFDSYTSWIHRRSFIPVKIEFYRQGKAYRTLSVIEVKTIQGYQTATKVEVTEDGGGKTTLEYMSVKYDGEINPEYFTERFLRTPPPTVERED